MKDVESGRLAASPRRRPRAGSGTRHTGETGAEERDECLAALVLYAARGVGPVVARKLRTRFGSYREAVAAATAVTAGELPDRLAGAIRRALGSGGAEDQRARAEDELVLARSRGARLGLPGSADYPQPLSEIARPPILLYVAGSYLSRLQPALAIVGTRAATRRGSAVARDLAFDAAQAGLAVVSGLARGIDTAAHEGALEAGGATVAVLGSGLARIYPRENKELARRIARSGALVSEYPMLRGPRAGAFPARNRIISGLSAGVVVVEAGQRSGALITAARALEEGREVFAVPGPVTEPLSSGPNGLIKAGAKLVEGIEDILEELEPSWGPLWGGAGLRRDLAAGLDDRDCAARGEPVPAGDPLSVPDDGGMPGQPPDRGPGCADASTAVGARVVSALGGEPRSIDEVAAATGLPAQAIASTLLELELAGRVGRCPGGRYALPARRVLRRLGRGGEGASRTAGSRSDD